MRCVTGTKIFVLIQQNLFVTFANRLLNETCAHSFTCKNCLCSFNKQLVKVTNKNFVPVKQTIFAPVTHCILQILGLI